MNKFLVSYKSIFSFFIEKYHNNRKLFLTVIFILLIVPLFLYFINYNNKKSSDNSTIEGHEAFQRGDYDKAMQIYSTALKKDKNNSELLSGLIEASSAKGNKTGQEKQQFKQIEPYIQEAIKVVPDDPKLSESLGYAYETAGDYQQALAYYEKVVQLTPDSSSAWFHHGHVLEFLGEKQKAYADYEKAYSLDNDNPQVLIAKGNMLLNQNKLQEAYDIFIKASDVSGIPNSIKAEALTAAAIAMSSRENFKYIKESLMLSKEAVEADPGFSPALAIYGYNLYLTEDKEAKGISEGINYLQKAISANPRIAKNYYVLGLLYRANKDYSQAIANFQQAIDKIDQDNTVLSTEDKKQLKGLYLYDMAKTYDVSKTSTDTLKIIKQAISFNPHLKDQIKEDIISSGYFQDIKDNQDFVNLIK
jgi:tetratricopeptide (TPR) repeat protein